MELRGREPVRQNINPPSLVDGQYLFLSSTGVGARGLKLTNKDGKTEVEELWSTRKVQFYHVTSVLDGDYVYGSSGPRSPAFMAAINVKTGEIPWRKRGFAKANAVYADGRMIVLDEDGKLYLTTPTPEDLTVHSEATILTGVAWTTPTIVGKTMYVRDKVNIMAMDLGAGAMAKEPAAMAKRWSPRSPSRWPPSRWSRPTRWRRRRTTARRWRSSRRPTPRSRRWTGCGTRGAAKPMGIATTSSLPPRGGRHVWLERSHARGSSTLG